VKFTLLSYSEH